MEFTKLNTEDKQDDISELVESLRLNLLKRTAAKSAEYDTSPADTTEETKSEQEEVTARTGLYLSLLERLLKIDECLLSERSTKHNAYLLFKFGELAHGLIQNSGVPSAELAANMNFFANLLRGHRFQSQESKEKVMQLVTYTKQFMGDH